MDWQLLGNDKETNLRKKRGRERKGRDCQRWCSLRLRLGPVCCHCASVIAGGQICQDRAAFPQRPQPLCWNAPEKTQARPGKRRMDADPLPLLHLRRPWNSKLFVWYLLLLTNIRWAFQTAEHKISVNSLVKTDKQALKKLISFIHPLNPHPQMVISYQSFARFVWRSMVTGAQSNELLWTRLLVRWGTTRWGTVKPSSPASVVGSRSFVSDTAQTVHLLPSCPTNEKIWSRIVLKATQTRTEKTNITTQKRCQSSSQIFGWGFFFNETYTSRGARF